MSRIGKLPISIPAGVTVTLKDNVVTVKGPKGELTQEVNPAINVEIEDGQVVLKENENAMLDNQKQRHAFHGLYRALINNMVIGVSQGYKKELELVGVGYRASNNGNIIDFSLGYTHSIVMQLPAEIKVENKSERNKNNLIILSNGKNVSPEEIEEKVMSTIPYVKEILVYQEGDKILGEMFLNEEDYPDARDKVDADIKAVNAEMPAFKRITKITIRDTEFPKTTTMKIARKYHTN